MYPPFRRSPNLFLLEDRSISYAVTHSPNQNNNTPKIKRENSQNKIECMTTAEALTCGKNSELSLNTNAVGESFGVPVLIGIGLGCLKRVGKRKVGWVILSSKHRRIPSLPPLNQKVRKEHRFEKVHARHVHCTNRVSN